MKELTENVCPGVTIALAQLKLTLLEKIETIRRLDEQMLEGLEKEDIEREIEESSEVKDEIYGGIAAIEELLAHQKEPHHSHGHQNESAPTSKPTHPVRIRLPKLEVRKFAGKIHEWIEFWDSFNSATQENESLSKDDKFTYLCGLAEEPAKSAISGFSLTEANYSAAVELLQRWFGNKTVVQRAHINELINVKPVFNSKDTRCLRWLTELERKECVHYLPHQAVIHRDFKTTKLRVVYDASSKEGKKGTSLHDCLHVGPSLTPMLYDILLKFRENRIVLVGDIEKAFLNVEVDKGDRDYLRFLWVKTP